MLGQVSPPSDLDHTQLLIWVIVTVSLPIISILGAILMLIVKAHRSKNHCPVENHEEEED